MFVCNRMHSGYEHVRGCGERLEKEKEKLTTGQARMKTVLVYSNAKGELNQTTTAMAEAIATRRPRSKRYSEQTMDMHVRYKSLYIS